MQVKSLLDTCSSITIIALKSGASRQENYMKEVAKKITTNCIASQKYFFFVSNRYSSE